MIRTKPLKAVIEVRQVDQGQHRIVLRHDMPGRLRDPAA